MRAAHSDCCRASHWPLLLCVHVISRRDAPAVRVYRVRECAALPAVAISFMISSLFPFHKANTLRVTTVRTWGYAALYRPDKRYKAVLVHGSVLDSCRPVLTYVELAYCLEGENPSRPGGAEPLPLVFGAGAAPCAPCCPDSAVAPALSASGSSILSLRSPVGTCTWLGSGVRVRG